MEYEEKKGRYSPPAESQGSETEDDLFRRGCFSSIFGFLKSRRYVIIFIVSALAAAVPIFFLYTVNLKHNHPNYGTCRLNETYRIEVGPNLLAKVTDLATCEKNFGCWNTDEETPEQCYHSIPSTVQYYFDENHLPSLNENVFQATIIPARILGDLYDVTQVYMFRVASGVIGLDFRLNDSQLLSTEGPTGIPWDSEQDLMKGYEIFPGNLTALKDHLGKLFYLTVQREEGDIIFDTRYTPFGMNRTRFVIGTSLPSRYFHGLKGGEGFLNFQSETVKGLVRFGSNEMPFYMSYHENGTCHGVLFDTQKPFVAEFIQGPVAQFEFQGDFYRSAMKVRLFLGPQPKDVLSQLRRYIIEKAGGDTAVSIPKSTYNDLGVHFCRRSKNVKETKTHLEALENIPYDSDCISENLRTPFDINRANFAASDLENDVCDTLRRNGRTLTLSQKFQRVPYENEILGNGKFIVEIVKRKQLIHVGAIRNENNRLEDVCYFSVFSNDGTTYLGQQLDAMAKNATYGEGICPGVEISGIDLVENFPRTDFQNWSKPLTVIEAQFGNSSEWNLVNPKAIHINASGSGLDVFHFDVANVYGEAAVKLVKDAYTTGSTLEPAVHISTASEWTETFLYASSKGIQVPFTWSGFRDALAHYLRYFMFKGRAGIPICGSSNRQARYNSTEDTLCLRWFQTAMLLPYVQHTFPSWIYNGTEDVDAFGFKGLYQRYVSESIRNRYTMLPYYYTQMRQYEASDDSYPEPLITPVSYRFPERKENFFILDQFMIGEAIMAAPMVERGTIRSVYFPPGTWYSFRGERVSIGAKEGVERYVTALADYTPLFLRDGFIVPILERSSTWKTATEAMTTGRYSLLVPYPTTSSSSEGTLLLTKNGKDTFFDFTMNQSSLRVECRGEGKLPMSSIKLFGFSTVPKSFTLTIGSKKVTIPSEQVRFNSETKLIKVNFDQSEEWCDANVTWET